MSLQLQLEVSTICNGRCVFCVYPTLSRRPATMDFDLSARILDEAALIPLIDEITFAGCGETLLDRHLVARVRRARAVMPTIAINLYTNGTYLREPLIDRLVDAGLTTLIVSLNASDAEKRQWIMGLDDYDHVVRLIAYAQRVGAGRMAVQVKAVASKDLMEPGEATTFLREQAGAVLQLEGNWAGALWPLRVPPKHACDRAFGQIMVLVDGRVALCCFDAEGAVILGDLNTQTLREVYNGPIALAIRTAHAEGRRAELPLCALCTSI